MCLILSSSQQHARGGPSPIHDGLHLGCVVQNPFNDWYGMLIVSVRRLFSRNCCKHNRIFHISKRSFITLPSRLFDRTTQTKRRGYPMPLIVKLLAVVIWLFFFCGALLIAFSHSWIQQVYRLIVNNSYEKVMFERASQKLALDVAVLHSMKTKKKPDSAGTFFVWNTFLFKRAFPIVI